MTLPVGEYTLKEVSAPDGYAVAADINFTVEPDGKVMVKNGDEKSEVEEKDGKIRLTMVDVLIEKDIEISKVDNKNNKGLAGATLQITKKKGEAEEIVEQWETVADEKGEVKAYRVTLPVGEYTLKEVSAPDGYAVAADINFTVEPDGKVMVKNGDEKSEVEEKDGKIRLTMVDVLIEKDIEISKVDLTTNTELEGASLQITKDNDDTFEAIKWKSGDDGKNEDGTVKTHTVKLTAGTYILSETAAPDGYNIAASIKFTIDKEGKVTSETKDAVTENKVTMKDEKKDTSASISVTKISENSCRSRTFLQWIRLSMLALYEDEDCTQTEHLMIKALTFKNSDSVSTVTFDRSWNQTQTYYVGECTKDGVRYLSGHGCRRTKYAATLQQMETALP